MPLCAAVCLCCAVLVWSVARGFSFGCHCEQSLTCVLFGQTPIDEVDAAARVLDPIFSGVSDPSKRAYGVFFKVGGPFVAVIFFLRHRSHSISFTRAQGIAKYKLGFGSGK